jgi:anaerobic ribonucleoside-triphosphate reductase/intein/homing endonuclease
MVRLSKQQLDDKANFITSYLNSTNAADASKLDANANVSSKNIATLEAEINKDINVQINRYIISKKIEQMFDKELAVEYNRQIEDHEIYVHDETSLKPYTYGPSEAVMVIKNGKKLLTTFELLYASYSELDEELLDVNNGVYAKYPSNLFINDINGRTRITRLVKKDIHRDMVRVKTKYGEDLIVTDNHPLIIETENPLNTVEASNSVGMNQFKNTTSFDGNTFEINTCDICDYESYGSYVINSDIDGKKIEGIKSTIELTDKLGYAIGFFIAEGNYTPSGITITQGNKDILKTVASYIYTSIGIAGKIYKDVSNSHNDRNDKYVLSYSSQFLKLFMSEYCNIPSLAERKGLPENIYETNREFVDGLLSGLIDGDGTVGANRISIRLASRGIISQLSILLRSFGFGISNSYQEQSKLAFGSYSSNYPIFGISFGLTGELEFKLSYKINKHRNLITTSTRYNTNISEIISTNVITNESYLDTCIYDITTESSQFLCNNLQVHNCTSITMYPFLLDGLTKLGGESEAPTHISSFCGSFVNLIFAISSQFAGAVASVEFLMYFDYFARKDYGDDYLNTHKHEIENHLQHVVYAINQPAAARGYQCVREDTTQLSTPDGFKYLHELKEGDKCYVWKDGKIAIEPIKKLNVHKFDGELMQFKGRNYQQTVTSNHRVLYKKPNTGEYDIKEAKDLFGHSKLSLPIGSDGVNRDDYGINDSLLKLCVAALTDGTIEVKYNDDNFSGRLTFYKSKNRYGHIEIQSWLNELGISYSITEHSSVYGMVDHIRLDTINSQIILRQLKHTKADIPYFFKLLSKRQLDIVLDEWSKFDGNANGKHVQLLQCDSDSIRDSIQELCILAGRGSEIYDRSMTKFDSDEECIVKYVKVFKRSDKRVSSYNMIEYTGNVWCPTTDAGVVIFREDNNIPYITGNSVFWNISLYDEYYFNSMFGEFVFPDANFTKASFTNLEPLQNFFMEWFNAERLKHVLTFPVVTAAMLTADGKVKDRKFAQSCAKELHEGNSFFMYMSDSADSLSSCCRLKSTITDNSFSYSLGAGGVSTGSINVMTINMNRLIQDGRDLGTEIEKIQKYQVAYRSLMQDYLDANMLTVYDAGFIDMKKQFLTIGINGMVEAAEFKGYTVSNNDEYKDFVSSQLHIIYDKNKEAKEKYGYMFNTEFVPAENLGVKNAKWDKKSGYVVNRDCYNSYFYAVEDVNTNHIDKLMLHGDEMIKYLDGGSALHLNLDDYLSEEAFLKLLDAAAFYGCNYFTTNVKITICNDCDHIEKTTESRCLKCGSRNIDYATRVIGYLKRVNSFSSDRQREHDLRYYE